MLIETKRRLIFLFCFGDPSLSGKEVSERGPGLGAVGVKTLSGDEFLRRLFEAGTVLRRLLRGWHGSEQRGRPHSNASHRVGQGRCHDRPQLLHRNSVECVERADAYQRILISQ